VSKFGTGANLILACATRLCVRWKGEEAICLLTGRRLLMCRGSVVSELTPVNNTGVHLCTWASNGKSKGWSRSCRSRDSLGSRHDGRWPLVFVLRLTATFCRVVASDCWLRRRCVSHRQVLPAIFVSVFTFQCSHLGKSQVVVRTLGGLQIVLFFLLTVGHCT